MTCANALEKSGRDLSSQLLKDRTNRLYTNPSELHHSQISKPKTHHGNLRNRTDIADDNGNFDFNWTWSLRNYSNGWTARWTSFFRAVDLSYFVLIKYHCLKTYISILKSWSTLLLKKLENLHLYVLELADDRIVFSAGTVESPLFLCKNDSIEYVLKALFCCFSVDF